MRAIHVFLHVSTLTCCLFCSTIAFTQEPFAESESRLLTDSVDELNFDSPAIAQELDSSPSDFAQSVVSEGEVVEIAESPLQVSQSVDSTASQAWRPVANDSNMAAKDLERYLSIRAGGIWLAGEESGFVISAAVGKRFCSRMRAEFEFAHRSSDVSLSESSFDPRISRMEFLGSSDVNSLMSNVYIDFDNRSRFTPYAGVGLGVSFVDFDTRFTIYGNDGGTLLDFADGLNDTVLGYQFIGGVSAELGWASEFIIEYRYFGTTDVEIGNGFGAPYLAHNLLVGVQRKF